MKIAVLAWGSLLWSPRELAVDHSSEWNEDGPFLPIEFSRIASDGRLTLVIDPGFDLVQVYWKLMSVRNLGEARKNLQQREGAETIDDIGFVSTSDRSFCMRAEAIYLKQNLFKWTKGKALDATIWTDLKPKFIAKTGKVFTESNAEVYLKGLTGATSELAREYILNTPPNIRTRFRSSFENLYK